MAISKTFAALTLLFTFGSEAYRQHQQTMADLRNMHRFRDRPETVTVYWGGECGESADFCETAQQAAAARFGRNRFKNQRDCVYQFSQLSCGVSAPSPEETRSFADVMTPDEDYTHLWQVNQEGGYPVAYRPTTIGFAVADGKPSTATPVYQDHNGAPILWNHQPIIVDGFQVLNIRMVRNSP